MALVGGEFLDKVQFYWKAWWPARKLVEDAVKNRFQVSSTASTSFQLV